MGSLLWRRRSVVQSIEGVGVCDPFGCGMVAAGMPSTPLHTCLRTFCDVVCWHDLVEVARICSSSSAC